MTTTQTLIAAAVGLGLLLWYRSATAQPELPSGGGEITTDDPSEGTMTDFAGLASEARSALTRSVADNPTTMSLAGLDALQQREGFAAEPYSDFKGYSIGYGHLIKPGEQLTRITREQGAQLLAADVAWAEAAVRAAILVPISQSQFDALVSFCFNIGGPAFSRSTLVRRINDNDPAAAEEFGRWINAGGQPHQGLIARRAGEREQFETA